MAVAKGVRGSRKLMGITPCHIVLKGKCTGNVWIGIIINVYIIYR